MRSHRLAIQIRKPARSFRISLAILTTLAATATFLRHEVSLDSFLQTNPTGDQPEASQFPPRPVESAFPPVPTGDQPAQYQTRTIEGWTVHVNEALIRDHPELAEQTLTLLRFQLYQVTRKVPSAALEKLKTVVFWVEENEPNTPCMTYHPAREWLVQHGVDPRKAGCVELANARNFLAWTLEQPWMVLHELAHAYHHKFLEGGFQNREIRVTFDNAMKQKLYQRVLRITGEETEAYAARNPMEYFAEATEAFFGTNDFYPYVRSELKRHDTEAYRLLQRVWHADTSRAAR